MQKYGTENFSFLILEFIPYSIPNITDAETDYLCKFPKELLFNFKLRATSIEGYVHTEEAKQKIRTRFLHKENHPMYNKHHKFESLVLISKPGKLNPIFEKQQSIATRQKISESMSAGQVRCYDVDRKLIHVFPNNVKIAEHFKVSKATVGRYIASGKLFLDQYYLEKDEKRKLSGVRTSLRF